MRACCGQVCALAALLRHITDTFGSDRRVAAVAIQLCAALAATLPSKPGAGLGFGLTRLGRSPEAEDRTAALPLLARAAAAAFACAHADARASASAEARPEWTAELTALSCALVRWLHGAAESRTRGLGPAEVEAHHTAHAPGCAMRCAFGLGLRARSDRWTPSRAS